MSFTEQEVGEGQGFAHAPSRAVGKSEPCSRTSYQALGEPIPAAGAPGPLLLLPY